MDLALADVPAGDHDLRVTNPDGGSGMAPAAATVLGLRTLASGVVSSGRPSLAYNAEDDEYLAAYSVHDGTQWDVRARRFSAWTGKPAGNEVSVTSGASDGSSTEDQTAPCVVYSPEIDRYFVAYAWKDASASGDKAKVRSQLLKRDGTVDTEQAYALTVFTAGSGTVGGPRVAWNAPRQEWLVVWAFDASLVPDIRYASVNTGLDGLGNPIQGIVGSGVLVATTHDAPAGTGTITISDKEYEPDVAWSSASGEFLVSYTFDEVEGGESPPPDSGTDVRAKFFSGDFGSGPSEEGSLSTLGNVSGKDERRSRVAHGGGYFLVAWDYAGAAGDRDVRVWVVNPDSRAKVGGSPATVDRTGTDDTAEPAVASNGDFLIACAVSPGSSGASAVLAARYTVTGGGVLSASPSYRTLAAATANAAFALPDVAFRTSGGEYAGAWTATGSGKDPADAEIRIAK